MACIVLVEDNAFIREAAAGYLQLDGHSIIEFGAVKDVVETVRRGVVDLAILDIMLPDGNGFNLAKSIKEVADIPLIFLTAKSSESDRILGFELGADDYVVKPFSPKELALRVQALLKRYNQAARPNEDSLSWTLEGTSSSSTRPPPSVNGEEAHLTGAEWKILAYIAEQEGLVVSRERLLSECLNYFFEGSERTIDTHIANLRGKLGSSVWIETVRGYGYRFAGARKKDE
jgi:two-component system phosphate regulon response regulator PhoB